MRVDCTCQTCGTAFTEIPYRAARGYGKFCSWACRFPLRPGVVRDDGVVMVPISSGEFALIDSEDAAIVLNHNWHLTTGYAATAIESPTGQVLILMHKLIMGDPPAPGLTVDHVNRVPLDNRRRNLRWASRTEQAANTKIRESKSGYKGVSSHHSKWRAKIFNRHLGLFHTPEEAARAYDAAAIAEFGEFACLNFPPD